MRIGMVIDNEFIGDPRPMNEARYLQNAGHEVYVLCYEHRPGAVPRAIDGIQLRTISISKKKAQFFFGLNNTLPIFQKLWTKHLNAFVEETQVEVLHAHDLHMVQSALRIKYQRGIPVVLDMHEYYSADILTHAWVNSFPRGLLARAAVYGKKEGGWLEKTDRIISLSDSFSDYLCTKHPRLERNKFVTYPNVPNLYDLLRMRSNIRQKKEEETAFPVLFYFGRISEGRGIYEVIDALDVLREEFPSILFKLAGKPDKHEEARFKDAISRPSLQQHVCFLGWQNPLTLGDMIDSAHICLSPLAKTPQHESGVANKVFQYMYFERPLLVSDCAPQQRIVESVGCGKTYRSGSTESMVDSIRDLCREKRSWSVMGKKGRDAIENQYNTDVFGLELKKLYENFKT